VLFSEPKIPQPSNSATSGLHATGVSVLFSEPKIPQHSARIAGAISILGFQCSSASRKFLNQEAHNGNVHDLEVSVLFSEPKIPQPT